MSQAQTRSTVAQLPMPGMPEPLPIRSMTNCREVAPGEEVMYMGTVSGGPRYGSLGVIKQTLRRKAVVDMGRMGTWHIPYFFLVLPRAA